MKVITQNSALSATGILFFGNVADIGIVTLDILDDGVGSTVTFSYSANGTDFSNLTTGIYKWNGSELEPYQAATTVDAGKYVINVSDLVYFKAAVTTLTSGKTVLATFDYSVTSLEAIVNQLTSGITAAGATQATATALAAYRNIVSTVASSEDGVLLPAGLTVGEEVFVKNADANTDLKVYPRTGGAINGGSANAAVTVPFGFWARFVYAGSSNWWSYADTDTTA